MKKIRNLSKQFLGILKRFIRALKRYLLIFIDKFPLILFKNVLPFLFTVFVIDFISLKLFRAEVIELSIVNFAFAIPAAISSICFSWSSTYNIQDDFDLIKKIRRLGERSLQSTIIFLFILGFKYFIIYNTIIFTIPYGSILKLSFEMILQFTLFYALAQFSYILREINVILFDRLWEGEKK